MEGSKVQEREKDLEGKKIERLEEKMFDEIFDVVRSFFNSF